MKDKIFIWFNKNWKPIGYTLGIVNIMSGLANISTGDTWQGMFWILIGSMIVYDARKSA